MTSVDLVKFAQALLEERILYRRYLDLMWTKQRLNNGNQTIHTLGFFTKYISQIDREVILHRGLVNGFYGSLVIDPESEVVIGLLCNSREENQVGVTTRLLDTAVSRWEPIMHVLKKKKKTFPSAIPVEPLKPTTRKPRKREISQANVTPNPVKFEGLGLR